jgi:hypothetical protein
MTDLVRALARIITDANGDITAPPSEAAIDAAQRILEQFAVSPAVDNPVRARDQLRVGLINPDHIHRYHYNSAFHANIDWLIGILPVWVHGMAKVADDQDAMLTDMTRNARWDAPVVLVDPGDITFADLQNMLRPTTEQDPE